MSKNLVTLPPPEDDDVSPPDVEEEAKVETKPVAAFAFKKRKTPPANLKQRARSAQDSADSDKKNVDAEEAENEDDGDAEEDDDGDAAAGSALATAKKLRTAQLNKLKGKTVQKMDKSTSGGLEFAEKSEGRVIASSNVDRNVAVTIEQVKRDPNLPKWKGPMRESANVRAYSRMDYQPDICKDYKETGYCGYGDNCKFMHDRGDYKSGWQLEREWKEEQDRKARQLMGEEVEGEVSYEVAEADEFPWKCLICRRDFTNPVVTKCKHYFCEKCALTRYVKDSKCFACKTQTEGVFNTATKLIAAIATRKAKGLKGPADDEDQPNDANEAADPEPPAADPDAQEPVDVDSIFRNKQKRQSSLGWAFPNPSAK